MTGLRIELGLSGPYDIIAEGTADLHDRARTVDEAARYSEVGATWWLDADWAAAPTADPVATLRERVLAGPPR